jgi:nucleotide-binding universal stress UspA family protein
MAKILVAYDGSSEAKRALDRAALLAKAEGGGSVAVISVVPVSMSSRGGGIDPTSNLEDHKEMLREAKAQLAAAGIEPELIEAVGHPAESIVKAAEDEGYDAVVLGSRGLSGIRRALMGSVSSYVATHAPCDVYIARHRAG